ncbi:hypothetical protein H5399_05280 [Tessaracoccus sp. MC1627]|uniref:hypothetical protein n=1 Tax=Tessaracoccus sp. MC1627 TaxID=2760312 RepID=UPI00160354E1|nr:hypothetical protein [Tessaracoccus sp. MC1627]MBB1512017.1 hypothetical protein [Tessaracoccus sp. MC1627]
MSTAIVNAMQHTDAAARDMRNAAELQHPADVQFSMGSAQINALLAINANLAVIAAQLKRLVDES